MPCYLYIDGKKQEMDEDIFDQMVEALNQPSTPKNTPTANTRWRPDGTYDKRPLDEDYFNTYYQETLKIPFKCSECGRTISSKSNLSKHRQTNVCMSNPRHWWSVEVQQKSPKPEPQTPAQNYLKTCHLI